MKYASRHRWCSSPAILWDNSSVAYIVVGEEHQQWQEREID
jgi:hypothetical protein